MKHVLKFIVLAGFALFILEKTFSFFISFQEDEDDYTDFAIPNARPNNGVYKQLDENGNLLAIQFYNDGLRDSTWTYFFTDGNIRAIIKYRNNLLHGKSRYYDQGGGIIYEENYKNGKLTDVEIRDDSLYKYRVQLTTHGKVLYQNTCAKCHHSIAHKATDKLKWMLDSLKPQRLSLDSMHHYFITSDTVNHHNIIPEKDSSRTFKRFDIDAMLNFLLKEKDKSRQFPYKHRRSLIDKPKTVLFHQKTDNERHTVEILPNDSPYF